MKFIDLFSGIGAFRMALEKHGHKCVAFCEIDKHARNAYKAIYDTSGESEYHDIRKVLDDEWAKYCGTVDILTGGFPCQTFSIIGKRQGFNDVRGTMFFELARAAQQIKPRFLLLENVTGLLSHNKGKTFITILTTLDELGYDVEWQVINSKNYVPQSRDRVYIVGHYRGQRIKRIFPIRRKNATLIKDEINIITINPNHRDGYHRHEDILSIDGISRTITAHESHNPTIVAIPTNKGQQLRQLTPRECWRLQGFPDWAFDRAAKVNSNRQLRKQAGNSATIPVLEEIVRRLSNERI